ncbi:MAG: methyltransferase domain-containing protein [Acidobacteriota bacterium]|nr:methyltransferase domain-containing protein [Acidobacteriota bacterium]
MKVLVILAVLLLNVTVAEDPAGLNAIYREAVANKLRTDEDFRRDVTSKPVEVLAFAGVKPGMRVLDLFAGSGYYSEILSLVVGPQGQVTLHNNQAYIKFVKQDLNARLAGKRLPNVVRHVREAEALELPDEGFDAIFMVLAFHDIYFKSKDWSVDGDKLLKQVKAALKPDGVLLLIDHAAKEATRETAAQDLHRIDEAFTKEVMASYGFKLVKQSDILRNPGDDRSISVFDDKIRRKTDRFVHLYKKQ